MKKWTASPPIAAIQTKLINQCMMIKSINLSNFTEMNYQQTFLRRRSEASSFNRVWLGARHLDLGYWWSWYEQKWNATSLLMKIIKKLFNSLSQRFHNRKQVSGLNLKILDNCLYRVEDKKYATLTVFFSAVAQYFFAAFFPWSHELKLEEKINLPIVHQHIWLPNTVRRNP